MTEDTLVLINRIGFYADKIAGDLALGRYDSYTEHYTECVYQDILVLGDATVIEHLKTMSLAACGVVAICIFYNSYKDEFIAGIHEALKAKRHGGTLT